MIQLAIFKYEEEKSINDFTTIDIDGEPWFVAAEVCALLDIKNVSDAISSLDDDEKTTSVIPRGSRRVLSNLINESGLYNLIFKSKKPSAKAFRKWVTKEVIPTIRKTGGYGSPALGTPNFVRRFNDNWDKTDRGHFSVISELFVRLYGKFEMVGYLIPDKAFDGKEIRPDVSVGKLFSTWLQENHPDQASEFKYYKHTFPSGLTVDARQYKNSLLHLFMEFVDLHWMPKCAAKYLGDRDKAALDYLPKLLM
jgi:prophage antirepressor-like protein